MILAELVKLRRSALWVVALVLPVLTVVAVALNYIGNQSMWSSGWAPFWSQVVQFYGLLFLSMGVAVLASAAWRTEHRGHNWNLLMATPTRPFAIVAAAGALTAAVWVFSALLPARREMPGADPRPPVDPTEKRRMTLDLIYE